ncbi:nitronate monooxygenase, partial [Frankia sp. AiPs1]|uniref:nitronate monooxygenase n=1 Tax=Frankia sp. AiPs1 TaxID=573493 RepID=UPI0020437658
MQASAQPPAAAVGTSPAPVPAPAAARQRRDLVLGVSPLGEPDPRLVAALCHAGAWGVLDLGRDPVAALAALHTTARLVTGRFGIRLAYPDLVAPGDLAAFADRIGLVLLPAPPPGDGPPGDGPPGDGAARQDARDLDWQDHPDVDRQDHPDVGQHTSDQHTLDQHTPDQHVPDRADGARGSGVGPRRAELAALPGARRLVEVTTVEQARAAAAAGAHGLVARGNEAGGRVGELGAFVLLQQLLDGVGRDLPVWCWGGIGVRTAAAAVVGGAAGVVLDSQLALLAESDVPAETAAVLRRMDGTETVVAGGHRVLQSALDRRTHGDAATWPPERVLSRLGSSSGGSGSGGRLLPVGQDGYLAGVFAQRYG